MSSLKILVLGATGLCGKFFVQEADTSPFVSSLTTLTRRNIDITSTKLNQVVDSDTDKWGQAIAKLEITPDVMFSGLGTTRGKAGGLENQFKIDHDLNLAAATAAKEKGVKTYILVSSAGASANSYFPYFKLKGQIEDDIINLKFDRTIILRPGFLLGDREASHGIAENISQKFGRWLYGSNLLKKVSPLTAAQGYDVARASLELIKTEKDKSTDGPNVEILDNEQILKLSRSFKDLE